MQLSKEELTKLRSALPHGACARIAKRLDCHRNNIYNVLNGTNKNDSIINEILAEIVAIKDHDERISEIIRAIK